MRVGWLVLLAFAAVRGGSVVGLSAADKRAWSYDVLLVGLYVGWVGIGVTAAVMLGRGVPGDGVRGRVEWAALGALACLGLLPLLYVGLIAVLWWNN